MCSSFVDGKSQAGLSVWRHTYGIKVLQVPWYVKWGLGAVNTLAGLLPSMVPSLPEVHKKDHMNFRQVT